MAAIARRAGANFGVSRVTDVTRMDRLGIPVAISVRPSSNTLCVHAGKGLVPLDAHVGAWMEAIEFAAAEPGMLLWDLNVVPFRQIGDQLRYANWPVLFDVRLGHRTPRDYPTDLSCVEGIDLVTGLPAWVPAELVLHPSEGPLETELSSSTNGLASGATVDEATLHALLEVLERDTQALAGIDDEARLLLNSTLPAPWAATATTWSSMGVELCVRPLEGPYGLPCFEACICDPATEVVKISLGCGLHPDARIAVSRAICEAAQSRLSHIHGGRHDIVDNFESSVSRTKAAELRRSRKRMLDRWLVPTRRTLHFADLPWRPLAAASINDVLPELLQRIVAAGLRHVWRVVFPVPSVELAVVRIVVPGAEDTRTSGDRLGPRLALKQIHTALQGP